MHALTNENSNNVLNPRCARLGSLREGLNLFYCFNSFSCSDLTCNDIAEIRSQAFFNMKSLKDLRLTECNIQRLANMSFDTLSSLESL